MFEHFKLNLQKKKVDGQRIELKALHTQLEMLNEFIKKEDQNIEQVLDVKKHNENLIQQAQLNKNNIEAELKNKKEQISEIENQTYKIQKELSNLIDDLEKKQKLIEEFENKIHKKTQIYGEVKSTFDLKRNEHEEIDAVFSTLNSEVHDLKGNLENTNSKIGDLKKNKEAIIAEIKSLELKREELQKENISKDDKFQLLSDQYKKLENKREEVLRHISFLNSNFISEQDGFTTEVDKLNVLKKDVEKLTNSEAKLKNSIAEINGKVVNLKNQNYQTEKEIDDKNLQITNLKKIIEVKTSELEQLKIKSNQLQKDSELLSILSNERQSEMNRMYLGVQDLNEKNETLTREIKVLETKKIEFENKINQLTQEYTKKQQQLFNLDDEVGAARSKVKEQEERVTRKQKELNSIEQAIALTGKKSEEKEQIITIWNQEIQETDVKIDHLKNELDTARESLVAKEEEAKRIEVNLIAKRRELTDVEHNLINCRQRYKHYISQSEILTKKIAQVKSVLEKRYKLINLLNTKIEEKEGHLIKLSSILEEEQVKEISVVKELNDTQVKKQEIENDISSKELKLQETINRNKQNKTELAELTEFKIKLLSRKTSIEAQLRQLSANIIEDQEVVVKKKNEISELESMLNKFEGNLSDSSKLHLAIIEQKEEQSHQLRVLNQKKQALEQGLNEVNTAFSQLHQEYTSGLKLLADGQNEIASLKKDQSMIIAKIDHMKAMKVENELAIEDCERLITELKLENLQLLDQFNQKHDEFLSATAIQEELNEEYNQLKIKESTLRESVNSLNENLNAVQEKIDKTKIESEEIKSEILRLHTETSDVRLKASSLDQERKNSISHKTKIEDEFKSVQKIYQQYKFQYDEKKSLVDSLKDEISKKLSIITKSKSLMPKLEKMVESLSKQQIFLLKSNDALDKVKEQKFEINQKFEIFDRKISEFSNIISEYKRILDRAEVYQGKIKNTSSEELIKEFVLTLDLAHQQRSKINGHQLVIEFEELDNGMDTLVKNINASFDHFANGDQLIQSSETTFTNLKTKFEDVMAIYQNSNEKFNKMSNEIGGLLSNLKIDNVKINNDFYLTALYNRAKEHQVKLEIDDFVIDTLNQNDFRVLFSSIESYSLVASQLNRAKLNLKVFRIKNFGEDHIVMRYENLRDFNILSFRNNLPTINKEIKDTVNSLEFKFAFKGHVDNKGQLNKLDMILKYVQKNKKTSAVNNVKKTTHFVKSKSNLVLSKSSANLKRI